MSHEQSHVPNVRKIAVLRALVLGDLIFILPALEALHQAYPDAELVLLTRPWAEEFVRDRVAAVSRVVTFREAQHRFEDLGIIIDGADAARVFPQLRAEHFDLAISMQGGGINSNPFLRRLGARVTVGSREPGAIATDRWIAHDYYQHDVIRNLELARLVGAEPVGWSPRVPVLAADCAEAEPWLRQIGRPFVVLHAGARDIRRCWPPAHFAVLADRIRRELGYEVVLTGTGVDEDAPAQVAQLMREPAINLSGKLSLPALIGVLSSARLLICNDTGVLHLGLAVGTQAIGLFWSEYISKSLPLSRELFQPLIAWERRCPLCGTFLDQPEVVRDDARPCRHLTSFVAEIRPDDVFAAAERMLEQPSSSRGMPAAT